MTVDATFIFLKIKCDFCTWSFRKFARDDEGREY